MGELLRYAKKTLLRAALSPLKILPVRRDRILLVNDLAYNYSGNPKYIAEYLRRRYAGRLQLVFAGKGPKDKADPAAGSIRFVDFNSPKYFYYAMTSKVLVTNSGGFSYIPLRKRQCVINTWHGGGAYKKAGIHMFEDSWLFRKDLMLSAKKTALFLSTNRRFTEVMSESMLVPKAVFWEIGMPRNDLLLKGDETARAKIRAGLGLRENERLVLFAPTYRKPKDDYFQESIAVSYGIDPDRVCRALKERFGGDWRFAIRLHPCVVNREDVVTEGMLDLTDHEDMQELLLAADVMINDFSSSMWDFMLTGKPSFLFALDLQHYVETTEVYTPVSEWPFPKSTSNDELESSILDFDEGKYAADCRRHYEALGGCESGTAAKQVCEKIFEVCFGDGMPSS